MSADKEFTENVEFIHQWAMTIFNGLVRLNGVDRAKLQSLIPMYDAQGMTDASRRMRVLLPLLDEFNRLTAEGGDDDDPQ